nr:hypothetical protein [Candidatus Cloacimonadota bacterium]
MGGYPILNYLAILAGFLVVSLILYYFSDAFMLSYMLVALLVITRLSSKKYNDFLKLTFSTADYYKIRLAENLISALPFLLFLCAVGDFQLGLAILISSALLVFIQFRVKWQIVIPTPFSKYPFEFIVGFRVSFIVFALAYFLTYISIRYTNFGIGIFALLIVPIVCTMFYFKVEDVFYVWIFSSNAKRFLIDKVKIAFFCLFLLCLPIVITLSISYPTKIPIILICQIIGLGLICASVLAKYSSFPNEIGKREGLLVLFSIIWPILLFFTIPYLFKRSIRSLEGILG